MSINFPPNGMAAIMKNQAFQAAANIAIVSVTLADSHELKVEAVNKIEGIEKALSSAFEKVKDIVEKEMHKFSNRSIEDLENVLIYPVAVEDCRKQIDACSDLPSDLQEIPYNKYREYEFDKEKTEFTYKDGEAIGLYRSDDKTQIGQIFLYVDKIKESAKKYGCELESMIIMVLLHELAHAAMDVFDDVKLNNITNRYIRKGFYNFREESLANAIAYALLCNNDVLGEDKIRQFIENQPAAYRACLCYNSDLDLLVRRTTEWIKMKTAINLSFNDDMACRWVDTLLHGSDAELAELEDNFLKL